MTILWEVELPYETKSDANTQEHWGKRHKRHQVQRQWIDYAYMRDKPQLSLPCQIFLTRISPRKLDYDNLVYCFKFTVDVLCDKIIPNLAPGRADANPNIKIFYDQDKGNPREIGVKIKIVSI